jgi:hypothetical protein
MQNDGNLLLYSSTHNVRWSSDTYKKGVGPFRLAMQNDGNLVLYDSKSTPTWCSDTWRKGSPGHKFVLENNGDLVLYDGQSKPTWKHKNEDHSEEPESNKKNVEIEGEFKEVAISNNKVENFESILQPLKLTNYNLGQIIRSNSNIHIVHVKSVKVLNSGINLLYDSTNLQQINCVQGRLRRPNCWSFYPEWSFTIRKDQDYSGNDPLTNFNLVNIIHSTSKRALYWDDGKQTPDGKETHVSARNFQDDLIGFQWNVNFVYSPYGDDYLRSGTIIKITAGAGPLFSQTDMLQYGDPSANDNCVFVNSNADPDSEGNYPDDENEYWVVLEEKDKE